MGTLPISGNSVVLMSVVETRKNQPEAQKDFKNTAWYYTEAFDHIVMHIEFGYRTGY